MKKKILSFLCAFTMMFTSVITPVYAEVTDTQTTSEDNSLSTDIIINGGVSSFKVTIPKAMSGTGNSGELGYLVTVEGDITGSEMISVIPDSTMTLSQEGKDSIVASITQDRKYFYGSELVNNTILTGNGNISYEGLSAGTYNGIFYFNIGLKPTITVEATNSNGDDIHATANFINDSRKDELLDALVATGNIDSKEEVDALIEVESDNFEGLANTTFNVSSIADEGDKVAILHFDEKTKNWELIGVETVDSNGNIGGNFNTYSPVAFVKVTDDGSFHVHTYVSEVTTSATCTENGLKTYTCEAGDDTYTEVITSDGHCFTSSQNGTLKTAATCTSVATYYDKCSVCGIDATTYHNYGKALGHNYVNKVCTRCGIEMVAGLYDANDNLLVSLTKEKVESYNNSFSYTAGISKSKIVKAVIPEGTTKLGGQLFLNCTNLKMVDLPDGIKSIDERAFQGCNKLESINMPNSITSIGDSAFQNCANLLSMTIPSNVTSIGVYAFCGCEKITSVVIPSGVTTIQDGTFNGCHKLKTVTISNGVKTLGDSAFQNCIGLTSIVIPSGVTSIGNAAFAACDNLESVTIPSSVTSIGEYAFPYQSLTNLTIPSSVKTIGQDAFWGILNVNYSGTASGAPWGAEYMNKYFDNQGIMYNNSTMKEILGSKKNIVSITIPNSVTKIYGGAFTRCQDLVSITWRGVTYTDYYEFNSAVLEAGVSEDYWIWY